MVDEYQMKNRTKTFLKWHILFCTGVDRKEEQSPDWLMVRKMKHMNWLQ